MPPQISDLPADAVLSALEGCVYTTDLHGVLTFFGRPMETGGDTVSGAAALGRPEGASSPEVRTGAPFCSFCNRVEIAFDPHRPGEAAWVSATEFWATGKIWPVNPLQCICPQCYAGIVSKDA